MNGLLFRHRHERVEAHLMLFHASLMVAVELLHVLTLFIHDCLPLMDVLVQVRNLRW